jgi:hypothetical protein
MQRRRQSSREQLLVGQLSNTDRQVSGNAVLLSLLLNKLLKNEFITTVAEELKVVELCDCCQCSGLVEQRRRGPNKRLEDDSFALKQLAGLLCKSVNVALLQLQHCIAVTSASVSRPKTGNNKRSRHATIERR